MALYRPIPETIEASQWFKNGDHPHDGGFANIKSGNIVKRFCKATEDFANDPCNLCGNTNVHHGLLVGTETLVCPGDYIVTLYDPEELKRRAVAMMSGRPLMRRTPKVIGYQCVKRETFEARYEKILINTNSSKTPV